MRPREDTRPYQRKKFAFALLVPGGIAQLFECGIEYKPDFLNLDQRKIFDFKILRKVEDNTEKINAVQDFFFRQRFESLISNSAK